MNGWLSVSSPLLSPSMHLCSYLTHCLQVTAVKWLPGGWGFVSASLDRSIILWGSQV